MLQEDLDFIDERGYVVRIIAGVNIDNRQATWELLTLDPVTGNNMHQNSNVYYSVTLAIEASLTKLMQQF